jgi:hypothetical protein
MTPFLWATAIVLVICLLVAVLYILIHDTDRFNAVFKSLVAVLATLVGGSVILPHISGTTSVDFSLDGIFKLQSSELKIDINPPDGVDGDKSNSVYCITGLVALSMVLMFFDKKRNP